jgi:hypothetical protein
VLRLSGVRSPGICLMVLRREFPKCPLGRVSYFHVIGELSSFGYLHINIEETGWQTPLGTLIHLLPSFPLSLRFSLG